MRGKLGVGLVVLVALAAACSSHSTARSSPPPPTSNHPAGTASPSHSPAPRPESLAEEAADAYVWGFPLVVTERTLQSLTRRVPENRLTFQPALSTVTARTIVAPNADTLYAVAPLDLRGEPYVLTLPAIHDRYYSFQLISAYTDSFAYIGTRATGGRAGSWIITPPGWHGRVPAGVTRLASPTPQLLLLGRFLATSNTDVARVHALSARISLEPLSTITGATRAAAPPAFGAPAGTPQTVGANGIGFFDELGDALAINPPTDPAERAALARYAALGIGPGRHPSVQAHDPRVRAALTAGVRVGSERITDASGQASSTVDGWAVNLHIGTYGHDALLRAVVAKNGWGANVPAEAVYAHALQDAAGAPLNGANRYVVHFGRDELPPVRAFWSVTMYGLDLFFVANPIDRYAIGDRTAGLRYNADGSLDLYIQHDAPAGHESNWLPAPPGAFLLIMRLYLPQPSVLDDRYEYPRIIRAQP